MVAMGARLLRVSEGRGELDLPYLLVGGVRTIRHVYHNGALVANAPHMPVHLGSMDRSVETIIRLNEGDIHPGDVFALNAPYNGGTHLPDITVVTPVFDDNGVRLGVVFFALDWFRITASLSQAMEANHAQALAVGVLVSQVLAVVPTAVVAGSSGGAEPDGQGSTSKPLPADGVLGSLDW